MILRVSRRSFAAGGAAFAALAGTAHAASLTADEVTIGATNAPLHLIEYASLTCPHCAEFHAAAWSTLQSRYIETGRVRFTFREMATAPPAVALAMFQLARCETTAPGRIFAPCQHPLRATARDPRHGHDGGCAGLVIRDWRPMGPFA